MLFRSAGAPRGFSEGCGDTETGSGGRARGTDGLCRSCLSSFLMGCSRFNDSWFSLGGFCASKTGGCLLPHMHPGVWEGERAATGRGLNYYRAWLPARSSWGLPLARSWQFTGLSLPWGEGEKNRGSHVSAALPGRTLHSDVWLMSPL